MAGTGEDYAAFLMRQYGAGLVSEAATRAGVWVCDGAHSPAPRLSLTRALSMPARMQERTASDSMSDCTTSVRRHPQPLRRRPLPPRSWSLRCCLHCALA